MDCAVPGLVPIRLLAARVCCLVARLVILHEDFKFIIFSSQLNHSPGAFKIVIFAGGNSVSSFGFVGVRVGAWKNSWKLAVKLFV